MITLMLCFFVMLYNPTEVDITQLATITQSLQMRETETTAGGLSLSTGRLADLGNNINALPAMEKWRSLANARKKAVSLSEFFRDPELKVRRFRIEGHTDNTPVSASSAYPSNWELSAARAMNVLHYLADFGVDENRFSIAGYADTRPMHSNDTPEGRAYNRRVDIIILDEGHF